MTVGQQEFAALDIFVRRRTVNRLSAPGPDDEQLALILEAADRAPDHGRCRPWRFSIVTRANAHRFGAALDRVYRLHCAAQGVAADEAARQRERDRPHRSPILVVVTCHPTNTHRIPVREQRDATAAAVQNMLLATTILGFGSKWSSGPPVVESLLLSGLGFERSASLVGFIHIGSVEQEPRSLGAPRPLPEVARPWQRR